MSGPARPGAMLPPVAVRRLSLEPEAVAFADDSRPATALPFNGGRALNVAFTASPQSVQLSHRLGRKPTGYIVTRTTGGLSSLVETASDQYTLTLEHTGGAAVSVSLWVY